MTVKDMDSLVLRFLLYCLCLVNRNSSAPLNQDLVTVIGSGKN